MTTKRLIRISYFTMLTIVGGLIKLPMPAVPGIFFTFQTVFVALAGLVLGARDGALSQLAYMIIGLIGLPVFTTGGGIDYVLRPSFGYIIGFVAGAFLIGLLKSRFKTLSVIKLFFCAFFGLLTVYIIGMPYQFLIFWLYLGNDVLAAFASLATLPLMFAVDAAMLYLICLIYPRINTMIGSSSPPSIKNNGKSQNIAQIKPINKIDIENINGDEKK